MSPSPAGVTPCQIYAVLEVGAGARERLEALLAAWPLTSVLLRAAPGRALAASDAKPLVDLAQARNCAALIENDAALARVLRADGVHLNYSVDLLARFADARETVGSGVIVGVDAGGSRHVAMECGERGADYVGFSSDAPAMDDAEDEDPGPRTHADLIVWWADVFEVPCVALGVAEPSAFEAFRDAGADFVAVTFAGGEAIADAVARLTSIGASLGGD